MNNPIINGYLERHETVLQNFINQADIQAPALKEAIQYCLFPGGKRLRPLLVYLTGEIIDANIEALDGIAAAIELVHCYSLVQDDLPAMDNDDFRRGRLTCHRAFNEATAILLGDGMQGLANEILLTQLTRFLSDRQIIDIAYVLLKSSGFSGMVSGQSLDLTDLCRPDVTKAQLQHIHRLKTGSLFSACINMTLISGRKCDKTSEVLHQFANYFGMAFQMQDDYHDRYSSNDALGKNRASDEANKKTTFASLMNQQELLELIHQHYNKALLALEPLGEKANNLSELTRYLHQRTQ